MNIVGCKDTALDKQRIVRNIFLMLLTFNIIISCRNKLDSKVENAVNLLSHEKCINTVWTEDNDSYKNLIKVATVEDLVYLTDSENPYIRYYAFIGLKEKNYPKIKEIYFKHKNDFEAISTTNGACLNGSAEINDLMFWALDPKYSDCKYGFTQDEYDKMAKEEYDKNTK